MKGDYLNIGADIASSWTFDETGDLKIVDTEENIAQAIGNRLQTNLNSLDLFYADYGSVLQGFLGWKRDQRTLDFMRIEIVNRLSQDLRLSQFDVNVSYTEDGNVQVDIQVYLSEDDTFATSIVLNNEGVVENGY